MATATPDSIEPSGAPSTRTLWSLAWPIVLARAGILTMGLVDVVMVSRYDRVELGYAQLGLSLFIPLLVTGIGLMIGVRVLASQAVGAGRAEAGVAILRRSLPWALTLGLAAAAFCAFGALWLRLLGQSEDLARGGGEVAQALALSIPLELLVVCGGFYLEATGRPRPAMVAMVAANLLNVLLNWILIYGQFGLPALGAVGSALATTAVRAFLCIAIFSYIFSRGGWERAALRSPENRVGTLFGRGFWGPGGWREGAAMRQLGVAGGVSFGLETAAYALVTQMAGWLGEDPLAAFAIAYNIEAFCFMIALGLGGATAVLVGRAIGRRDRLGVLGAARVGLSLNTGVMLICAVALMLGAPWIAAFFAPEPDLAATTTVLLRLAALVVVVDGAQMVMAQAVQALGDSWGVARRFAVAYWVVLTPLAYIFAFPLGWGGEGLWIAVIIGCAVSFLLMTLRFRALTRRLPTPQSFSAASS